MIRPALPSPGARELGLQSLSGLRSARWSSPKDFRIAASLHDVPVAESELLQLSHHVPIAIKLGSGDPEVVAIVAPALLRTSKVGASGRWLPVYLPIALRCLPFWPSLLDETAEPQVATDLGLVGDGGQEPFFGPNGQPTRQTQTLIRTLRTVSGGLKRLTEAAQALVVSDVLVPVTGQAWNRGHSGATDYHTVDEGRFNDRSGASLGAAIRKGFLALDLAGACLFSRRHFARDVVLSAAGTAAPPRHPGDLETILRAREPLPVALDDSDTFDIGEFV